MQKTILFSIFLVLSILTLSPIAWAALDPPVNQRTDVITIQEIKTATAINTPCDADIWSVSSPACTYFVEHTTGWSQATLHIKFTKTTASYVYMQCDSAVDKVAGPWATVMTGFPSVSEVDMKDIPYRWNVVALVAGKSLVWRANLKLNDPWFRCRFWTDVGAGAGDTVKVDVTYATP